MKTMLNLLSVLACCLLSACGTTHSDSLGGETNWLVQCSDEQPCSEGSCLCGVCTKACSSEHTCSGELAGECVDTAAGAGEALCASQSGELPDAVCLPKCDSNAACGSGYRCTDAVCIPRAATVEPELDGGPPRDACAAQPDAACEEPDPVLEAQLATLAQSEGSWEAMSANNGDSYWYEEENCVVNAPEGTVTRVQVEAGEARIVSRRALDKSECLGAVNRYEDFTPKTMPELYAQCRTLLQSQPPAVAVTYDATSILQGCVREAEPDCQDACGDGFLLRTVTFGMAPTGPDCQVDEAIYPSGTEGIQDPFSCTTCTCDEGQLVDCETFDCANPEQCPEGTARGKECAQCGPADGCEVGRTACLPKCDDEGSCPVGGGCAQGICVHLCG